MEKEELPNDNKITNQSASTIDKKKPGGYIMKHKMVYALLFILVVVSLGAFIKIKLMENEFNKQTTAMELDYQNKIDSLTGRQLALTSKVLSWAVRSELTRENKEQVNQFFMNFIKEPGVINVKFVDARTSKVTLSTDKKDESTPFTDQVALMTPETINYKNDSILSVITPIMNLNNKIGILVIEYNLSGN